MGGAYQFFADAPAILVLLADGRDYRYPDDRINPYAEVGAAIQNIYLLCETMGFGCCWASHASFCNVLNEDEVRRRLAIPKTHLIAATVALGKSVQCVCPIPRDSPDTRYRNEAFWGADGHRR